MDDTLISYLIWGSAGFVFVILVTAGICLRRSARRGKQEELVNKKKKLHTLNGAVNKRMILFSHLAPCFIVSHFCRQRQQPQDVVITEEEGYEAEYYQEFETTNNKDDAFVGESSSSLQIA